MKQVITFPIPIDNIYVAQKHLFQRLLILKFALAAYRVYTYRDRMAARADVAGAVL
jgi:hypothetical protein